MDEENKPYEAKYYEIRLSVRELVEFVLRSGDIDSRQAAEERRKPCRREAAFTGDSAGGWGRPTGRSGDEAYRGRRTFPAFD